MTRKQYLLFFILAFSSILSGATFGLLDVFGFIDGRHTISFSLLLASAVLLYFSLISIFLLEIAHSKKITTYVLVVSLLFGVTFFLMNLNILLTPIAVLGYFFLLLYAAESSSKRFNDFVRFIPQEIFFPVLKNSFLYILVMLSLLVYGQSRKLIAAKSLITPEIVHIIIKPSVAMLNQQVNNQLQSEVGETLAKLPEGERNQAIRLVLKKTVENMADKRSGDIYGIPSNEVPINKAEVSSEGKVNLQPVFEGMLPTIALLMNSKLNEYALIAPFIIALFTFLIFQPLLLPIQLVESTVTIAIFKLLIASGFIRIRKEQVEVERLTI
jgi:hypothetical protein